MSAVQRLPAVPTPPHDPTFLVLAGSVGAEARAGFRVASLHGIRIVGADACARLVLIPGPGGTRRWAEVSGSFGGLRLPDNVAVSTSGAIYLLDRTHEALKRFDPCECVFKVVRCVGPVLTRPSDRPGLDAAACLPSPDAAAARRLAQGPDGWFHGATAIAVSGGDLLLANPQLGRLLRLSLNGPVLRDILMPPPARPGSLAAGQRWRPRGLAIDGRGHLWVVDRDNGRLDHFAPNGDWLEGWAGLGDVAHVAVDCQDRVYLIIEGAPPVAAWLDAGTLRAVSGDPPDFQGRFPDLPFPVDAQGRLHLETWCENPCAGTAIFDGDGTNLPKDNAPKVPLHVAMGSTVSTALDSAIDRCVWHRVAITGAVPESTSIEVQTTTSPLELTLDELTDPDYRGWQIQAVWSGARAPATRGGGCASADASHQPTSRDVGDWDCLVRSPPGRFAWLRLVFRGDGTATPTVERILVEFPRISLRRFLPAVFGADAVSADFTDRFLGVFDTTLRTIERQLDNQARLFDPLSAPAAVNPGDKIDFLSWLGTWIGIAVDNHWPEERRRRFLKAAPTFLDARGTRRGLQNALYTYLGIDAASCCPDPRPKRRCTPPPPNCRPPELCCKDWERPPLILEHYQLRRWLNVGAGHLGDDSTLWGRAVVNRSQLGTNAQVGVTQLKSVPDPARDPFLVYAHRYTVFIPVRVRASARERKGLENLLRAESPAHTVYDVRYVEPRFRVGVQATLGFDAVVARTPKGARLGDATLRQGLVLSGPPRAGGPPSMVVGPSARVGTSTKVS